MTTRCEGRFAALALASLFAAGAAWAQPSGNPKGTLSPGVEGSAKSPATRNAGQQPATGAQSASPPPGDSEVVRSGNARGAGVGTAGGLAGRHPGDGSKNSTTETTQAPKK